MDTVETRQFALLAKNVCKSYEKGSFVLKNFCMSVKPGEIFSLLGASGCGKTIFSCILGIKKPDSGQLLIFGRHPHRILKKRCEMKLGYMPQEILLYGQLTASESITLYSRLYNLGHSECQAQWNSLKTLLDISYDDILISNLSGGQKRRVSLAVALIHSPLLLLLDEPTVGLDPLLRERVWNYLNELKAQGITTIITTHYVEETKHSDQIGFLRDGRLVAQDTPQNLLHRFGCARLEEAVLILCENDKGQNLDLDDKSTEIFSNQPLKCLPEIKCTDDASSKASSLYTLKRIYAYFTVLILILLRQCSILAMVLCFPIMVVVFGKCIFGNTVKNLPFAVVNSDTCAIPNRTGTTTKNCSLLEISCKYLEKLEEGNTFKLKHFDSEMDALSSVQRGDSWGYIYFPRNFSESLIQLSLEGKYASNSSITGSRIKARIDYSQSLTSIFLIQHLYVSYQKFVTHVSHDCNISGSEVALPIHFRTPIYGTDSLTFADYVLPSHIFTALFVVVAPFTCLLLITDIKQRTLLRARVAGLTSTDIIFGFNAVFGLVTFTIILILTAVLIVCFSERIHGPFLTYFVVCYLLGVFCISVGTLVAVSCKEEVSALLVFILLFLALIFLGGAIFPMEGILPIWKEVKYAIPTTLSMNALRSIITRGFGLASPVVWTALLSLLGWTVLLTAASFYVLKFKL